VLITDAYFFRHDRSRASLVQQFGLVNRVAERLEVTVPTSVLIGSTLSASAHTTAPAAAAASSHSTATTPAATAASTHTTGASPAAPAGARFCSRATRGGLKSAGGEHVEGLVGGEAVRCDLHLDTELSQGLVGLGAESP